MFYAKSNPKETIKEHTNELLKRYDHIYQLNKEKYSYVSSNDWEILLLAVKYHDIGKAEAVFQNKIRTYLKEPLLKQYSSYVVQHNYLSVLTIPYKKLALSDVDCRLLAHAIGYHHERKEAPNKEKLVEVYRQNFLPILDEVQAQSEVELASKPKKKAIDWLNKRITPSTGDLFFRYVMIKGLLHRLDHSASAHVPIELATDYFVGEYVNRFITKQFGGNKNELQQFAESNEDKHVIAIAQTGMGKTEAGLLWINQDKAFLTLPLRVSINAMYKRIRDPEGIAFSSRSEGKDEEAIGLLHSTSLDYLYEQEGGNESNLEVVYAQSRQFANKLIISTIDQILKFPFFYRGFEKELATLAGVKIVIDEMQSYNPKIAALIIRALELIDKVGGRFMIMTATMPTLYLNAIEKQLIKSQTPIVQGKFFDDTTQRHHIQIHQQSILDQAEGIVKNGLNKKILVICNTVKRAKEVYHAISALAPDSTNLLHSMFIRKDRMDKETKILDFASSEGANGIWITTQLVEASLDIDFDELYTEMSTLDSQFQRFGRCNRKGLKSVEKVNIHIFTEDVTGIGDNKVYHPDIYLRSVQLIQTANNRVLLESEKMALIENLYDENELKGTKFKQEFEKTLLELKNMPPYEIDSKDAQQLLRDIQQVQVIPRSIFNKQEVQSLFEQYYETKVKDERRKLKREIDKYSVGVNPYLAKELLNQSGVPSSLKELYVIECKYSKEIGIELTKEIDPFS
ncbi:CRISPR-associated helicase/endonuclease Cas3 [Bacillus solimangrovi]|uniref:HD Cas3-type domain-containing protein n=1 Tax=Bacillus solimangrovi TaxID=1305675 RepID=A0A1E5LG23_9BACI|nr:CRISPR-associated helicase/endonuclease Cas3 [Bacillus solimangrovi]OEH93023.1 hypothetical protein BFG57_13790 [Bacillus solimangrovi]